MSGEEYSTRNVSIWNQKYQNNWRLRFHQKASTLQCQCPSRYHQIFFKQKHLSCFFWGFLKFLKSKIMTWFFGWVLLEVIWMFPKIVVPQIIHFNSGFSIIFTIHFGVPTPIFGNTHLICLVSEGNFDWWHDDPFRMWRSALNFEKSTNVSYTWQVVKGKGKGQENGPKSNLDETYCWWRKSG